MMTDQEGRCLGTGVGIMLLRGSLAGYLAEYLAPGCLQNLTYAALRGPVVFF